jgi:hypothetical protein
MLDIPMPQIILNYKSDLDIPMQLWFFRDHHALYPISFTVFGKTKVVLVSYGRKNEGHLWITLATGEYYPDVLPPCL